MIFSNYAGGVEDFHCFRKIADWGPSDCWFYWPITPLPDPNPFYPRPPFSTKYTRWQELNWIEGQYLQPQENHYASTIMVSGSIELDTVPNARLNGNLDNVKSCLMRMQGNLANAEGEVIPDEGFSINFTYENPLPQESFLALSHRIQQYLEAVNVLSGLELAVTQYQIDLLEISAPFYSTVEFAKTLFSLAQKNTSVYTTDCLVSNTSDACCNRDVAWTGLACESRPQRLTTYVFDEASDNVYTKCHVPRTFQEASEHLCTLNSIRDYSTFASQGTQDSCAKNLEPDEWILRREMIPYRKCRDQFLGSGIHTLTPSPCKVDQDCNIFGGNYTCDIVHHTCLVPISTRFHLFFDCFIKTMDPFLLFALENLHNIKVSESSPFLTNASLWVNLYSGLNLKDSDGDNLEDCVDPNDYYYAFPHRFHYNLRPDIVSITCPLCDRPDCFDDFCTLPLECWVRYKTNCFQSWHATELNSIGCSNDYACNWNFEIRGNTAPASDACLFRGQNVTTPVSFCGVSDNGMDYLDLGISQAQCSSLIACQLADGSVIATSAANCTAYSCNLGPQYTTEQDCLAAGHCTNDFIFVNSTGQYQAGICLLPSNPFQLPTCEKILEGERPVKAGCVRYSDDGKVMTASECQLLNGTFLGGHFSKAQCDAIGNICVRPATKYDVGEFFSDELYTLQNEEDCKAQDGARWEPKYHWVPGKWLPSSIKKPKWVASAIGPRWATSSNTTILSTLLDDLKTAVQAKIRFQRKSYSFCRFSRYASVLGQIDCACSANDSMIASCFAESGEGGDSIDNTVALSEVCGGASATISSSTLSVSFRTTSLSPFGACVPISVVVAPAIQFQSFTGDSAATYFIDFSEKTEWSFRNGKDALVGQVIGDGVGVVFNETSYPLAMINDPVTLCTLRLSTLIDIQYPEKYTVLDFASEPLQEGETLQPLEVTVTEDPITHQLCTTMKVTNGHKYIPIQRRVDFASAERQVFTSGEQATLIVVIVCYVACILFAVIRLSPMIIIRAYVFGAGVAIPIFVLFLVRLVYFSMLVSGALSVNEGNVGVFLLIELPIMLYFTTTLYFVVNYTMVARTIRNMASAAQIRLKILRLFAVANVILYATFAGFLVAFALSVKKPQSLCGGRMVITDSTTGKIISMIYRVYMGTLAMLLGVGFFALGKVLLQSVKGALTTDTERLKQSVFTQAVVCSISLVAEAIFLLTIAALPSYQNNIFSMVWMLVCEIVPGFTIFYYLDVRALHKIQVRAQNAEKKQKAKASRNRHSLMVRNVSRDRSSDDEAKPHLKLIKTNTHGTNSSELADTSTVNNQSTATSAPPTATAKPTE